MGRHKMYGCYAPRGRPLLMIKDPELAKIVLVKDFSKFVDRQAASSIDKFVNNSNLIDRLWTKSLVMARGMCKGKYVRICWKTSKVANRQ